MSAGPYVKLAVETPTSSGEQFDLEGAVNWSVENAGANKAGIGYPGQGPIIDLEPGTSREFTSGGVHLYIGKMEVQFYGESNNKLLVIKNVAVNKENI